MGLGGRWPLRRAGWTLHPSKCPGAPAASQALHQTLACYFYYFLTFCLSNLCSLLKKQTISRRKILRNPTTQGSKVACGYTSWHPVRCEHLLNPDRCSFTSPWPPWGVSGISPPGRREKTTEAGPLVQGHWRNQQNLDFTPGLANSQISGLREAAKDGYDGADA